MLFSRSVIKELPNSLPVEAEIFFATLNLDPELKQLASLQDIVAQSQIKTKCSTDFSYIFFLNELIS
jgi:hypothetical protein